MTSPALDRELRSEASDPIGLDGIEFIEYTTPRPQALGQVLEMMGFRPIARHRSREVTLYRQGGMNIVVNASAPGHPRCRRTFPRKNSFTTGTSKNSGLKPCARRRRRNSAGVCSAQ